MTTVLTVTLGVLLLSAVTAVYFGHKLQQVMLDYPPEDMVRRALDEQHRKREEEAAQRIIAKAEARSVEQAELFI